MSIDKKIIEEISRYKSINNYILEQEELPEPPPAPEGGVPPAPEGGVTPPPAPEGGVTPPPATGESEPLDVENDPDVEKIDSEGESEEKCEGEYREELDITEMLDSQKGMEKKHDDYFGQFFGQL